MNSSKEISRHKQSQAIYIFIGVFLIVLLLVIAIVLLIQREQRRLQERVRYNQMTKMKETITSQQSMELSQSEPVNIQSDKLVTFAQ